MSVDADNYFQINRDGTPRTYRVYMRFPVEVSECWANLCEGNSIEHEVRTGVEDFLIDILFEAIRSAFITDGAAVEDSSCPSGLRPVKGELRANHLSRTEQIDAMAAQAQRLAHLARKDGGIKISGAHIVTDRIPTAVAEKALHMIIEASNMLLSAACAEKGEANTCRVRMSALCHIDKEGI